MFNDFIDITQIYIPKYIYLDEIYDYNEILLNISDKMMEESRKRKRVIEDECHGNDDMY